MRLDAADEHHVIVTLSERNLRTLLHKAQRARQGDATAMTISKIEGRAILIVQAELDDTHYDRPEGGPGEMHPLEEAALADGFGQIDPATVEGWFSS